MGESSVKPGMEKKRERGEPFHRPPYGMTTNKQKHGAPEATEWVPKDDERFKRAIQILNEYGYRDSSPDADDSPAAGTIGGKYGLSSPTDTVRSIWKNREIYREVAEKHRPELAIMF